MPGTRLTSTTPPRARTRCHVCGGRKEALNKPRRGLVGTKATHAGLAMVLLGPAQQVVFLATAGLAAPSRSEALEASAPLARWPAGESVCSGCFDRSAKASVLPHTNSLRSMIRPNGRNCCRRCVSVGGRPGASESLGKYDFSEDGL
jgi:hypothetical protein